jgi:hypothetical protein
MSRRIKLKTPSKKSLNYDRDYDPTVPEIQVEDQRDVKRKTSSIRLINPNSKLRRIEGIDAVEALANAKKIEEARREVQSINLQLAMLDEQITNNSSVDSYAPSTTNRKRTKNSDDEESMDDEEDEDYEAFQKEPRKMDDNADKSEDSIVTDDEDTTFDSHDSVAATRSKRPPMPSQKYPALLKSRNKPSQRRARVERSQPRLNDVITSSPAPSKLATSTSRRLKLAKPVLDVPFWKPIKATANTSNSESLEQCHKLLVEIQKKPDAHAFKHPVDPVKEQVLDYFTVIKQPMDLSTVQKNLKDRKITTAEQFYQQMRLIWDNCILFNGEHHSVSQCALRLSQQFEIKMKPILAQENPKVMDANELKQKITILIREYKALETDLANLNAPLQEPEKMIVNPADPNFDLSPHIANLFHEADLSNKTTIDYAEKCHLYNAISGLQPCFHRGLYQLVVDSVDKKCIKNFSDYVEVDSDYASPALLIKLQIYIRECRSVMSNDKKAPQTPGNQLPAKREESEQSSSTSESDSSDSEESSERDPRLKTGTLVGIFNEKKTLPTFQQSSSIPQSLRLFSSSPSIEDNKLVVLRNSDSWSQLITPTDQNTEAKQSQSENWENLKNRKTQIEQLEKEKEEQETLRNQQIKMKAEEEAKRLREEMENKKKEAELAEAKKREIELEKRAQMKAIEQAKRQEGLNATLLKQPVNMMQQFMIMSNFQSEMARK